MAVAPTGPSAGAAPAAQASVPVPVVLVPGWMGFPESMNVLAGSFEIDGRATYLLDQNKPFIFDFLGFPTTDTSTNGPRLAALVDHALAETGADQVDLVGYSYGGLVARHYVKDLGGEANVRRYVGIGVPQRGVAAACGLDYEEAGHLCPGTPFMSALNAGDDTPGAIEYSNIWSDEDGAGNVAVDGPVCVRHVPGVPHLLEPFSPAVVAEALARVRGEPCPAADRFDGQVPDAQGP